MTVIVCNLECMASDTQVTDSNGAIHHTPKVFVVGGWLVGVAGDSGPAMKYVKWREEGCKGRPPSMKKIEVLLLSKDGIFTHYYKCGIEKIIGDYHAIGTGGDIAKESMRKGSSPGEAVLDACEHNAFCGCYNNEPQVECLADIR